MCRIRLNTYPYTQGLRLNLFGGYIWGAYGHFECIKVPKMAEREFRFAWVECIPNVFGSVENFGKMCVLRML